MRPYLLATVLPLLGFAQASAQCSPCQTAYAPAPAPTVAYSPVVYQQTQYNGWYPGKYLADFTRSLFRRPVTTTTYTAGYAPTVVESRAASPYTVGYAPATSFRTAYRPTYPITYGPVVQTVSRPVVLSPVVPACNSCGVCNDCCVTQSAYSAPLSTGCSSCQSSATYVQPSAGSSAYVEPRPALAPTENPAADRSLLETQKPEIEEDVYEPFETETTPTDDAAATGDNYWRAPPLFAPKNRVTGQAHPAPVKTAVYRRQAGAVKTSFDASVPQPSSVTHLDASGWVSAAR